MRVAVLAFAAGLGACADDPRPCVTLTAFVPGAREGERLLAVPLANPDAAFTMTYLHSVTRTPVTETYRATAEGMVQTAIRFEQHGPGLPTAPAAGERWTARDGGFELVMQRKLESVVIRVHDDQSPQLALDGRRIELARWGNRPLVLDAGITARCDGPLPP